MTTRAFPSSNSNTVEIEGPLDLEASYVGDFYGNMTGGLSRGMGFLGMANLKIGFDTEKASWWKGGSFFINGASTHGSSPTEKYVGDFQVVSNIDAGNLIYLHELWYKQAFGDLSFTIGLQDMNATFVASDNGGCYLNSSFGIPPVLSDNIPVPIFPLTGLGLSVSWSISHHLSFHGAIFDGEPTDFDENPFNLNWKISKEEGLLSIAELQYLLELGDYKGTYKAGSYYHSGLDEVFDHNYGFYFIADQTLLSYSEEKHLDLFAQVAFSPGSVNTQNYYLGTGLNYHGIINCDRENTLGVAIAHAGFHRSFHKHETVIEAFFRYQLNDYIFLQPDFQLIINPAGTEKKLDNAMIGFLRVGIQF